MKNLYYLVTIICLLLTSSIVANAEELEFRTSSSSTVIQSQKYTAPSTENSSQETTNSKSPVFTEDLYKRQQRQLDNNQPLEDMPLVFGERLFLGNFADQQFTGFNPDYQVSIGDKVNIKFWGAYEYEDVLTVDEQGNIFVPKVGPVRLMGKKNSQVQSIISREVKQIFRSNVQVYASLDSSQTVKVFVTGFVQKPGLYEGYSSDSVLSYLDKAGGIDINRGSFIDIDLKRNGRVINNINLYNFMLNGQMPVLQLRDGDIFLIKPRQNHIGVTGEVHNAYQFEFNGDFLTGDKLDFLAKPTQKANFIRVTRASGKSINSYYISKDNLLTEIFYPDDIVEFISDKQTSTIAITVTGEHDGQHKYILPANSNLADLISRLQFNSRSNSSAIQIYRKSLAEQEKELLSTALDNLERKLLTQSSTTAAQAELQKQEIEQLQKFIAKARDADTKGRLVLSSARDYSDIYLDDQDTVYIPPINSTVSINGEVNYPNTLAHARRPIKFYVEKAGDFTNNADKSRALLIHQDGIVEKVKMKAVPNKGDEIIIMSKVKLKWFPFVKDILDITYKTAVSAGVLLRL